MKDAKGISPRIIKCVCQDSRVFLEEDCHVLLHVQRACAMLAHCLQRMYNVDKAELF